MILICLIVCMLSTMVGAISGIGGGVIIKPMLDMTLPLGMPTISLVSSLAVLSMSLFSVGKNFLNTQRQALDMRVAVPLAIGSTAGGVTGKACFNAVSAMLAADKAVKAAQNILLLLLMAAVLISALRKGERVQTKRRAPAAGLIVGFILGMLAAFLGIGGGPLNMLALTGFYGMLHKEAALYSLFVIIFSQTAGILTALVSGSVLPQGTLILTACAAGILGGIVGRRFAGRMSNNAIRTLYNCALVFIIAVCALNVISIFR